MLQTVIRGKCAPSPDTGILTAFKDAVLSSTDMWLEFSRFRAQVVQGLRAAGNWEARIIALFVVLRGVSQHMVVTRFLLTAVSWHTHPVAPHVLPYAHPYANAPPETVMRALAPPIAVQGGMRFPAHASGGLVSS